MTYSALKMLITFSFCTFLISLPLISHCRDEDELAAFKKESDKLEKIILTKPSGLKKNVIYDNMIVPEDLAPNAFTDQVVPKTSGKSEEVVNINSKNEEKQKGTGKSHDPKKSQKTTQSGNNIKTDPKEIIQSPSSKAEQMSSLYAFDTTKLFELALSEKDLYNKLRKHVKKTEGKHYAQKNIESLHGTISERRKAAEITATNPILIFKMIRRFVTELQQLWNKFLQHPNQNSEILKDLELFQRFTPFPTNQDLQDAFEGILRIQSVYNLDLNKFVEGKIGDFETKASFNVNECFTIGEYALKTKKYAAAIEWLEVAMKKTTSNQTEFKTEIRGYLSRAEIEHDKEWSKGKESKLGTYLFYNKVSEVKGKDRVKVLTLLREMKGGNRNYISSHLESMDICIGHNHQTKEEKSKLKCWFDTKAHPYWKINPLKTELLHTNPDLIQIYDFIGDKTIEKLQSLSTKYTRTVVGNCNEDPYHSTSIINSWTQNLDLIEPFQRRMELATGLQVKREGASEPLLVIGYSAMGSHIDVHNDPKSDEKLTEQSGDRIATFMVYLNEVSVGGATGFPMLGTSAEPVKGSAVFWYNFFRNGTSDQRTRHCGCPVILGKKRITNQWILAKENAFTRTCTLNQMD